MQAIMETLFDILYLSTVITLGFIMIRKSGNNKHINCSVLWLFYWGLGMHFI